jgi:hypothetical protein
MPIDPRHGRPTAHTETLRPARTDDPTDPAPPADTERPPRLERTDDAAGPRSATGSDGPSCRFRATDSDARRLR